MIVLHGLILIGCVLSTGPVLCQECTGDVYCRNASSGMFCIGGVAMQPEQTCIANFSCNVACELPCMPNSAECIQNCTSEGRFPDPLDCTKFYYCAKVGLTFVRQNFSCPTGYYFNTVQEKCIIDPGSCGTVFLCSSTGIFGDQNNNKIYYRCVYDSQTGEYTSFTYTCPNSSTFNATISRCV